MAKKNIPAKRRGEIPVGNFVEEARRAIDSIRQRAYELFTSRDFGTGQELDDWLRAEEELFEVPSASDLKETETEYLLTVPLPRLTPDQVLVSVEANCVTVCARTVTSHEQNRDVRIVSETQSERMFLQRLLRHAVDPGKSRAFLEAGVLTVTIPKCSWPEQNDLAGPEAA